ncbi:MAG: FlgD immunoglobulin-like domain containing protein [Candidatus Eisenbacteria bacterium]
MQKTFLKWKRAAGEFVSCTLPAVVLCAFLALAAEPAWGGWENGYWAIIHEPIFDGQDVSVSSDGLGGMIVALLDAGSSPGKIRVNRVDHVGTEIWGDGGILLPWPIGADSIVVPIDVAPDGVGGAYTVHCEVWGTGHYMVVTHVDPEGAFDWSTYVADAGVPDGYTPLHAEIEATGGGDAIVGWTHFVLGDTRVKTARVTSAGGVSWQAALSPKHPTDPWQVNWHMVSDGQGGVLVNYLGIVGIQHKWYIQRVRGDGVLLWGANGHELQGLFMAYCAMVDDGGGGAYLAVRDLANNRALAQHLNSSGTETWAAGGVVALPHDGWPIVCRDGEGGVFLAETDDDDIFAQHIDVNGTILWGANGVAAANHAGTQDLTSIVHDGFSGAILGYEDWYFVDIGETENRVPSAVRLGWFGGKVWEAIGIWAAGLNDGLEPQGVIAVADGSGGALFAWNEEDSPTGGADFVYGAGVNGSGGAPSPTLTYLWPDAGAPGASTPVWIAGEYLEASQGFALKRSGSSDLPITGLAFVNYQLLEGMLNLGGADPGGYDLVASVSGTPKDTLQGAFGVGEAPICEDDHPFLPVADDPVEPDESFRKAVFDADGKVRAVWVEYDGYEYALKYAKGGAGDWSGPARTLLYWAYPITHPSVAMGPDGQTHIACIVDDPWDPTLYYIRLESNELNVWQYILSNGQEKWNPSIAVTDDGVAHIVYQEGAWDATALYYVNHGGVGFSTPENLNIGFNGREPDLAVYNGNALVLTFVRNFIIPGFNEVCYQKRTSGGSLEASVGMYWGVYVQSPSVAWDGGSKVLFSWVLDNTGTDPLLHTCLMESDVLGPVRWRLGDPQIVKTAVAAVGPDRFYLLTEENEGALPMKLNLRSGDGDVFFPKRRLNTHGDVDFPALAAERGGEGVFAFWHDYQNPSEPLFLWECYCGEVGVTPAAAPGVFRGPSAAPNPFNPSTTLAFSLPADGDAGLAIYDVRGRRVRTLAAGFLSGGEQSAVWDGRDDEGRDVPSGVYLARLCFGNEVAARKLVLVR